MGLPYTFVSKDFTHKWYVNFVTTPRKRGVQPKYTEKAITAFVIKICI